MSGKVLIVVGGPNGAGKTTFVEESLRDRPMVYLGADQIAKEISPDDPESVAIEAGREFMRRLAEQLSKDESFIVETTLSGKSFRNTLKQARVAGFDIEMLFIFVESADASVARVQERKRKGGHDVPEADVRRRFQRSLHNFWTIYRQLADEWTLMYNSSNGAIRVAYFERPQLVVQSERLLTRYWELAGVNQ